AAPHPRSLAACRNAPLGSEMIALFPCPRCSRHVRASETACPFCALGIASIVGLATLGCQPRQAHEPPSERPHASAAPIVTPPSGSARDGGAAPRSDEPDAGSAPKEAPRERAIPLYGAPPSPTDMIIGFDHDSSTLDELAARELGSIAALLRT